MKTIFRPTSLPRRWVFSCLGLGFSLTSCSSSTPSTNTSTSKPQHPQSYRTPSKVNSPSDSSYLGISPEAATSAATAAGLRSRIVRVDGVSRPVTKDYRPSRLNFTVENGKVVKITKG